MTPTAMTVVVPPQVSEPMSELSVMTLNLQYFASYPIDEEAARVRLTEVTADTDVICVQEGVADRDVLDSVGFQKFVCSGQCKTAQSIHDMVYGDAPTLKNVEGSMHDKLLCNQIYLRRGSSWEVVDSGALQVSSDLVLVGGGDRAEGNLAIRSVVWVKMKKFGHKGPMIYIMNTHISGGRFEDQYFVQQLAEERFRQPDQIINFFNNRPEPRNDDVGILVGDFNATSEYTPNGPMHGYFKSGIMTSPGVQADAATAGLDDAQLNKHFEDYMIAPFTAVKKHGWTFAYDQEQVGATSGFGHLIDHMAMSKPLKVLSAEVKYLTNQKLGNKPKDTELPLTDHNAVKTVFAIATRPARHFRKNCYAPYPAVKSGRVNTQSDVVTVHC
jgi:endonuclease/exonuclease/phosphatase family metal-dependent hydrolase